MSLDNYEFQSSDKPNFFIVSRSVKNQSWKIIEWAEVNLGSERDVASIQSVAAAILAGQGVRLKLRVQFVPW